MQHCNTHCNDPCNSEIKIYLTNDKIKCTLNAYVPARVFINYKYSVRNNKYAS